METTNNIKVRPSRRLGLGLAAVAFLFLLLTRPVAAQTTYTVTDLGTLGGTLSEADTVTQRGAVAGVATLSGDSAIRGFVWTGGNLIDIGSLSGGPNTIAQNVNNLVQVTGVSDGATTLADSNAACWNSSDFGTFADPLDGHAFLWIAGTITDLGTLGGKSSKGNRINNRGQIAGMSQINTSDPNGFVACGGSPGSQIVHAFLYEKGKMTDIGTLGGYDCVANPINDRGQISGGCDVTKTINPATGYPTHHPFLWTNGVMQDLGSLGGAFGYGEVVSNQGAVVGFSTLAGEQHAHGFVWQKGVMTDLGVFPGDTDSDAAGTNSSGQIVGGSYTNSTTRGVLWQNGTVIDLNSLIDPNSGYQMAWAYWINDAGEIAGQAVVESTGAIHAVLLSPNNNGIRGNSRSLPLTDNLRKLIFRGYRSRLLQ